MIEIALVAALVIGEVLHYLDRQRLTSERNGLQRMLYAEDKSERIAALIPERKAKPKEPTPKHKPIGL